MKWNWYNKLESINNFENKVGYCVKTTECDLFPLEFSISKGIGDELLYKNGA